MTNIKSIMLLGFALASACTSPSNNTTFLRLLKQEGIENARIKSPAIIGCAEDDSVFFSRHFSGTKNGVAVNGIICGGLFKGYTIRYR